MDVRTNGAWLWKRLHGATDGEALHLASSCSISPTDPDAVPALATFRARNRRAPADPVAQP